MDEFETAPAAWHALIEASEKGDLVVVDDILREGRVDPSALYNAVIRCASGNGHLAIVERLLSDSRVDPSAFGNQAINSAVENGHFAIVGRLLKDSRVDPSDGNNVAIRWASAEGHSAIVERLLQDSRVDPSDQNNDAVRSACAEGHLAIVERLLQDDRIDRKFVIKCALSTKRMQFLLLPSLLPFVKDRDVVRQQLPQIMVKEEFVKWFEQRFTDAPPHVNKWVWDGGPGYHEGLEAYLQKH